MKIKTLFTILGVSFFTMNLNAKTFEAQSPKEGEVKVNFEVGHVKVDQSFDKDGKKKDLEILGTKIARRSIPIEIGIKLGLINGLNAGLGIKAYKSSYILENAKNKEDYNNFGPGELLFSLGQDLKVSDNSNLHLFGQFNLDIGKDNADLEKNQSPVTDNNHSYKAGFNYSFLTNQELEARVGGFYRQVLEDKEDKTFNMATFKQIQGFAGVTWKPVKNLELDLDLAYRRILPDKDTESEPYSLFVIPAIQYEVVKGQKIGLSLSAEDDLLNQGIALMGKEDLASTVPGVTLSWEGKF